MRPAEEIIEAARAKINLALHVTGQREDGYHLLESLVTFADFGDEVLVRPASKDSFEISGQFAGELRAEADNLVTRARNQLRDLALRCGQSARPVEIILTKNLPLASGIGGGSADAAATLRGLMRFWKLDLRKDQLSAIALSLGADVPMCMSSRPLIAKGVGEDIEDVAHLPSFFILLANPLLPVSTPQIFKLLTNKHNPPLALPGSVKTDWFSYLNTLRNDLQPPAQALLPEISHCLALLSSTAAALSRMSGSGASCFGLYKTAADAQHAAALLKQEKPEWYVQAGRTIVGSPT